MITKDDMLVKIRAYTFTGYNILNKYKSQNISFRINTYNWKSTVNDKQLPG